jgi:hypothetical protein
MKAGQSNLDVGTRIQIAGVEGEDENLNGLTGTATHPFNFGKTSKGWIGVWIDENQTNTSLYGKSCNIHESECQLLPEEEISKEKEIPAEDNVNHPKHYTMYPIEVIDMMVNIWGTKKVANYCFINAFKYRMRAGIKNNNIDEDLAKEKWYLKKAWELRKEEFNHECNEALNYFTEEEEDE